MSTWVAVETLTIGAAGFGVGPFVELVANDRGEYEGERFVSRAVQRPPHSTVRADRHVRDINPT